MDVFQSLIEECDELADDEPTWMDGGKKQLPGLTDFPKERIPEHLIRYESRVVPETAPHPRELWKILRDIEIPENVSPKTPWVQPVLQPVPVPYSGYPQPLKTFRPNMSPLKPEPKKVQPKKVKAPRKKQPHYESFHPRWCLHEKRRRHCLKCDDIICAACGKNLPKRR